MNIKQIEKILKDGNIEPNEARIEAQMLVKHFIGLSSKDLVINPEFNVDEDILVQIKQAILLRIEKRIPIQHIIGSAYFMGEDFFVNESVLIPRDETEILVRKAIEILKEKNINNNTEVLDIGTGSGCIACIIAKNTKSRVLGVDISLSALDTALNNSSKMNLYNKAVFRKSDIFSNIHNDEKFDVIISNPPYIPIKEKEEIQAEVNYEPDSALYTNDENGLEFYEKIIEKAPLFLKKNGYLMFELGIGQSKFVQDIMIKKGFKNVKIEKDLANIDRVIWGSYD